MANNSVNLHSAAVQCTTREAEVSDLYDQATLNREQLQKLFSILEAIKRIAANNRPSIVHLCNVGTDLADQYIDEAQLRCDALAELLKKELKVMQ